MSGTLRVLVCGGREFDDYTGFANYLYRNFHPAADEMYLTPIIIHGDAKGADFLARIWAKANSFSQEKYPANWKTHGKKAGPIRNQEMLDRGKPDVVVAFPGDTGTADMISKAKKQGVPVVEVGADDL